MLDKDFWFKRQSKKFLHNIDTFYYTVKLADDFTNDGRSPNVEEVRRMCSKYSKCADGVLFSDVYHSTAVLYRKGSYAWFYTFRLEVPEEFDFYFAPVVPANEEKISSVTSEIVVQIRSRLLWDMGAKLAFDRSFQFVKDFCAAFGLTIAEVKENRSDFCWHTNAIQNPESFFRIDRVASMQVSRFRRIRQDAQLLPQQDDDSPEYEVDYISLGKRGDKCFVRIYLKTKEVVQQGYKGWFFMYWFLNGMISRYDLYVFEKAYQKKNWNYVDVARLEFALEHDDTLPDPVRKEMKNLIEQGEKKAYNYPAIKKLADGYTLQLTRVLNVEYQVMRRMSKSFCLVPVKDNEGITQRIYDYFDNRRMITNYLTHDTLRLVDRSTNAEKCRCDYIDFWRRLRSTKQIDVSASGKERKLVRDYTSKLNLDLRKQRAIRSVSAFAVTMHGNPDSTPYEDAADLLCRLNDNDMHKLHNYKHKYALTARSKDDPDVPIDMQRYRDVTIIDEDGVFYEYNVPSDRKDDD